MVSTVDYIVHHPVVIAAASTAAVVASSPDEFWLRLWLIAAGVFVGTLSRWDTWYDAKGVFIPSNCRRDWTAIGLIFMIGMGFATRYEWDPWFSGGSAGIVSAVGVAQLRLWFIDWLANLIQRNKGQHPTIPPVNILSTPPKDDPKGTV